MLPGPERDQRAAMARLTSQATADVGRLFAHVDLTSTSDVSAAIVDGVGPLTDAYALAAGAVAAEWYNTIRERAGVRGTFVADPAEPPDRERYEALAAWVLAAYAASEAGKPTAPPDVVGLVSGGAFRTVTNGHRNTIMQASVADPRAKGWARFASGAETCDFCLMLTTRGAVYTADTAKFGAHDSCDCLAGPSFRGSSHVGAYVASARARRNNSADTARAKAWIERNLGA